MSKISDELRDYGRRLVSNASPFNCTFGDIRAYQDELADRIDAEMVELPRDRDGVPIHIGDTVCCEDGMSCEVVSFSFGRWPGGVTLHAVDGFSQWRCLVPERLTHERPDSLERIACDIETVVPIDDEDDERLRHEIADRIRRLAEKEYKR